MHTHFYRFYLSLPVPARNGAAGGRRAASSSLPRRVVGRSGRPATKSRPTHPKTVVETSFKRAFDEADAALSNGCDQCLGIFPRCARPG